MTGFNTAGCCPDDDSRYRLTADQERQVIDAIRRAEYKECASCPVDLKRMQDRPLVSCLCPTYCRPELLDRSIAMFKAQDYRGITELIVLDDSGAPPILFATNVWYISIHRRFRSLPEKFNALAGLARGEVLCVWEDDDEYRPWHISAHVNALQQGEFSKPSRVLSDYPGNIVEEGAAGRFHASMAFTRELFDRVGGWPLTKRADFDQQMIARLAAASPPVDTCDFGPPSYCFRWHTGHYHGQNFMDGPSCVEWYDRAATVK